MGVPERNKKSASQRGLALWKGPWGELGLSSSAQGDGCATESEQGDGAWFGDCDDLATDFAPWKGCRMNIQVAVSTEDGGLLGVRERGGSGEDAGVSGGRAEGERNQNTGALIDTGWTVEVSCGGVDAAVAHGVGEQITSDGYGTDAGCGAVVCGGAFVCASERRCEAD